MVFHLMIMKNSNLKLFKNLKSKFSFEYINEMIMSIWFDVIIHFKNQIIKLIKFSSIGRKHWAFKLTKIYNL